VQDGVVDPLLHAWTAAVGESADAVAAGRALLERYGEPHRRYHDRRHLAEVLEALRTLSGGAELAVPVVCAAYAHDAVHDGRPDDEQRSADLAARLLSGLGLTADDVDEVVRLVLLTVTHEVEPGDASGGLLCDADLAVLGAPLERYRRYATDVREEYAHVDDASFRQGRGAVLRRLLERPRLYATEQGHLRWDAVARRNLQDEISSLVAASDDAGQPPAGA
jgi:predicted metal-dependent HD superfamily phosphohydrolase